ncbi:MAG: hypothetical protein COT24_01785 [Candidatus Kerfeldbacteria bacterium CG08_land_8_20_14_0_20_40_16]|uniref:N-acetyltransferase domain-containing protein n=1 Tax=Candidatus Kerfeldbacteria bacterium CG08_land_8_20_14_0_20_40_16 TaxID=2014244 RepID=A0A2H0YWH0_9BACT|nr:MAG: hypothetical protein COT24_01785 [Candidatus Kerfeldbacteria bacterium CG08_land_8_20_14_0_20_40_16]
MATNITVTLNVPPSRISELIALFKEVAIDEMGWPAEDLIKNHVSGKEALSQDFVVIENDVVVGATKVIISRPFPVELPFPEVVSMIDRDSKQGRVVEVALTAVKNNKRGDLSIMLHLYRSLYHWSCQQGIIAWYSVQERKVTRLYRRLGLPFQELTEGRYYWRGFSYPCRLSIREAEKSVQTTHPKLWLFFKEE